MTAPFVSGSNAASLGGGSHSSVAVSLNSPNPNGVILIHATFSVKAGSTPTVTSITGGGLTFTKRVGPAAITSIPIAPSGTGTIQAELWWAPAAGSFSGTTFTVNFSAPLSVATGDIEATAVSISGCDDPTSPWDATGGLPATQTGAAPLTITFDSDTALSPASFSTGATLGSEIYFADGLVGTDGDELLTLFAVGSAAFGAPTSPWDTGISGGVNGAPAFPDFNITMYSTTPAPAPPPPPPASVYTSTKSLGGWRGLVGINWLGMALVGDAYSGVVGLSNFATFTEYQNPMVMRMTSPPIQNDRKRVFIRRFELDVQAATADATTPDPQLILEFSKDSGMTWEPLALARSMGEVGEYTKRLRWLNLGSSRSWVLRITIADPVRRAVIGAYLDVAAGLG